MRLTINKRASGKDAGFTFQDNFSTQALFGLLGDDNSTLKASPDASSFYTAWVIDRNNGNTAFDKPFGVNGGPAFLTIASDTLTITKSYIVPAPPSLHAGRPPIASASFGIANLSMSQKHMSLTASVT